MLWSGQGAAARFGFKREFREPVFIEEDASSLTGEVVTSSATSCSPRASANSVQMAASQSRSFEAKTSSLEDTRNHQKHKQHKVF
jgi:hypothetical protein